jgi:exopolysaccharide biosynthesis protein
VVRNGTTYVDHVSRDWDLAVLLNSGELRTYDYRVLTKEALADMGVYQTWVFGPSLLDEAEHAKTKFRSAVQAANPRSVLGYYEPGHYAFLVVDGRTKESKGVTMQELSQLCETLGFARAYNLDGGRSSVLISTQGFVNNPYRGGRTSSDIVAIRELPAIEPTPDPSPTAGD